MDLSKKTVAFVAITLLLAVMLSGCINLAPPPELTIKLTDPTLTDPELESVQFTITKIEMYKAGDGGEGNPITVFEGEFPVDLMALQWPTTDTVIEIPLVDLPTGDYVHFKLYLKELDSPNEGHHVWVIPVDEEIDPFACRVPPGKFNIKVWNPENGENSHFTIEAGQDVPITVTLDIQFNGNVASNPSHNFNPTGKAYVGVVFPDVTVTKEGPETLTVGQVGIYTITVEVAPDPNAYATRVNVTDMIPVGLALEDTGTTTGGYMEIVGGIIWNSTPQTIAPGNSLILSLELEATEVGEDLINEVIVHTEQGDFTTTFLIDVEAAVPP